MARVKHLEALKKLVDEVLAEPFDVATVRKAKDGPRRVALRAAVVELRWAMTELEQSKEKKP